MTCENYFSISLFLFCRLLFVSFTWRHRRGFRWTPVQSSPQLKKEINIYKPFRTVTFTNSTILFNVLNCTLMDISSHTSSNSRASSHAYFIYFMAFLPFSHMSRGIYLSATVGSNTHLKLWMMLISLGVMKMLYV